MMKVTTILMALVTAVPCFAQQINAELPPWQRGYLDIHHINTGHGVSAFFVFPDGTTMLVDAGEMDPNSERARSPRNARLHPDSTRPAHEWIASYIRKVYPGTNAPTIDYAIITHFHDDHFGGYYDGAKRAGHGSFYLTGITGVAEHLRIVRLLDRGYPEYNVPVDMMADSSGKWLGESYRTYKNYWDFIDYKVRHEGMKADRFKAGVDNQITLHHEPDAFSSFKVRNVKCNGTIWTGRDNETLDYFADAPQNYLPSENQLSIAMRIDYGEFRYYTGGDNPGIADLGQPRWNDTETPMTPAIGEVDVAVMDHHGNRDAHNEFNIRTLRPRIWIQQVWSSDHPGHEVLRRVTSQYLYPGPRDLFATNMLDANRHVIGPALDKAYKSMEGHIVVRVLPGGASYNVIILNDESVNLEVKSVHGPYQTKRKAR